MTNASKVLWIAAAIATWIAAAASGADQPFGRIKLDNADISYNDSTRVVDLYKLLLNTDAANSLVVEKADGTDVLVVDTTVPQITIGGVLITSANLGSSGSRVPAIYATTVDATTVNAATLAGVTTMAAHAHQAAGSGGTLDHGAALVGLADDDHTQYAKLAGRAGGTTQYGGTGAAEDLRLDSTSHATPGMVRFGGGTYTYYDEANETLHLVSIASIGEVKVVRPSALYFAIGTAYEGDSAWRFAINGRGDFTWQNGEGVVIATAKLWETMAHVADPTNDGETQAAVATIIDGLKLMGLMAPDP
jgi:hypothetical protein